VYTLWWWNGGGDNGAAFDALKQVATEAQGNPNATIALRALLGNLMSQSAGGQAIPTLRKLLRSKPNVVHLSATILDTALLMAESRHAALVVDDEEHLRGIFGFKDMMCRVMACQLPLDQKIDSVMTPEPDFALPDITVLEALQIMYDGKFLSLPVCEKDGRVIGLVTVIDLIYGCGKLCIGIFGYFCFTFAPNSNSFIEMHI